MIGLGIFHTTNKKKVYSLTCYNTRQGMIKNIDINLNESNRQIFDNIDNK